MRLCLQWFAMDKRCVSIEQMSHDPVSWISLLPACMQETEGYVLGLSRLTPKKMKVKPGARDFQELRWPSQTFPQIRRPAVSFGGLGTGIATVQASCCDEADNHIQFPAITCLSLRHGRNHPRGVGELLVRLGIGAASGGAKGGKHVEVCRLLNEPALLAMPRQQIKLAIRDRRIALQKCLGDLCMEHRAAAARQAFVSGLLHQRVLEGVARRRWRTTAEQQLGADDPRQRWLQRGVGLAGDGA